MNDYEIKFKERGLVYYEILEGSDILSVIGKFYNDFGYREILQIRIKN